VDHYLAKAGRLIMIETQKEVHTKIKAARRTRSTQDSHQGLGPALETIVENIVMILDTQISRQ